VNLTLMAAVPLAVNRRCRLGSSVTSGGSTVRARRTTPPWFVALANSPPSPPPAPALAGVAPRHIGEECKLEGKLEKLALAVTIGSGRARRAASFPPAFTSAASEGEEGMQQNILLVTTCISRLEGRASASRNTRRGPRGGGSARRGGAGSSRSMRLNAS